MYFEITTIKFTADRLTTETTRIDMFRTHEMAQHLPPSLTT